MPKLSEATDLMLFEQGLVSLRELGEDGPVLDPMRCIVFNEDFKIESRHDWSLPFLVSVDGETDDIQTCHTCGGVRGARFGPYLTGNLRPIENELLLS